MACNKCIYPSLRSRMTTIRRWGMGVFGRALVRNVSVAAYVNPWDTAG